MLGITIRSLVIATTVFYSATNAQKIIFLNGTTTSGKSSIAKELAQLLVEQSHDVAILAIDDFMAPVIEKELLSRWVYSFGTDVNNVNLISHEEMRTIVKRCRQELCAAAKKAYNQAKMVIIDDVMYGKDLIDFYDGEFEELNVSRVLVYCPILTLIFRIILHNNKSGPTEQRSILQSLDQFRLLYKKEEMRRLSIDILTKSTFNAAFCTASSRHISTQNPISDFLKGVQNALCPFQLEDIQQSMLKKFALDTKHEAMIRPAIEYHSIVNTEQNSASMCATIIVEQLTL